MSRFESKLLCVLFFVAALSFVSCQDDDVSPTTDPSITTSAQPKESRIIGGRGKEFFSLDESRGNRTNKKKTEKTGFTAGVTSVIFAGWKHFLLPFLMGVTLKVSTLVPVVLMVMTLLGGVSLLVSKLALGMAALTAGHQYFSKGESHHHVHSPPAELVAAAQAYPIPSFEQGSHESSSNQYQQYAAAAQSSGSSSSYPTAYSGSYSSYPSGYYKRVLYTRRR